MPSLPDASALQLLRTRGPLRVLSGIAVQELLQAGEPRTFAPGEALIRQGHAGDGLLILLEGSGYAQLQSGDGAYRIGRFSPGDVVGEMALVTREPRSADVIADTPVRALHVPTAAFDALAARHLELATMITDLVADRLGQSSLDGLGGKRVERFRILQCIGRGGMSVVYSAKDESTGALAALKMMSYRLIYDAEALARFRREAEVVQALQHPNIARLHRLFTAYRTYFLEMELLNGIDLQRLVDRRGRLPEHEVRLILGQLADALDFVHRHGIVHRDLKPSNVMITAAGVAKLTDFGIAASALAVDGETRPIEQGLVGTPAFMAPEQIAGAIVDHRADVYALGCVAYELLTGGRLFTGRNLLELVQAKLSLRLPPASEIAPGLSLEMYEFVKAALQLDPADRPSSLAPLKAWAGPCQPPAADLLEPPEPNAPTAIDESGS
jgi:CRP-like cAMP-binding protein